MPKAIWNGAVIAESEEYKTVEGNIYFPPDAVYTEFLQESTHKIQCHWKGEASYYSIQANGKTNVDAAWYYPDPKDAALNIEGYITFCKGIEIIQ